MTEASQWYAEVHAAQGKQKTRATAICTVLSALNSSLGHSPTASDSNVTKIRPDLRVWLFMCLLPSSSLLSDSSCLIRFLFFFWFSGSLSSSLSDLSNLFSLLPQRNEEKKKGMKTCYPSCVCVCVCENVARI